MLKIMRPFWMLRSWLGWLNFFVCQWFFFRLQEVGEADKQGDFKHVRWEFLAVVVPLTGWWQSYWFIYRNSTARRLKEPVKVRHAQLKRRLLRVLENGPCSLFFLERLMRQDGFHTGKHVGTALQDLVDTGKVTIKTRHDSKAWIYEKSGSTLGP